MWSEPDMISLPDGSISDLCAAEPEPRDTRLEERQRSRGHSGLPGRNQPSRPPIFIHSSWRASHTWFWQQFRAHQSTLCFYEPFHETLVTLTRSQALSVGPNSWDSGHPAGEPYRIEFVPLIRRAGGVRLITPEMSYQWFFPIGGVTGDLNREEALFALLGTTYGGDGQITFALPTVKPIFSATGAVLQQCIALQGIFPSRN